MIKNLGDKVLACLATVLSDVIKTSKYPESWKHAKIIAILKPKKPVDNLRSFRPISLLSCLYKTIERIILFCIDMIIDQMLPMEQAGFRPGRDTTEQVLALTSFVEAGFEKQLKTGTVFFIWLLPMTLYGTMDSCSN